MYKQYINQTIFLSFRLTFSLFSWSNFLISCFLPFLGIFSPFWMKKHESMTDENWLEEFLTLHFWDLFDFFRFIVEFKPTCWLLMLTIVEDCFFELGSFCLSRAEENIFYVFFFFLLKSIIYISGTSPVKGLTNFYDFSCKCEFLMSSTKILFSNRCCSSTPSNIL